MIYSKRVETFLKEVYERRPEMRRHPDYRMFYLYTDYPKVQESIIILTNGNPIPLEGIGEDIKSFAYIIIEVSDLGSDFDKQVNEYILSKGFVHIKDSTHHRSSVTGKMFCDKLYKKV